MTLTRDAVLTALKDLRQAIESYDENAARAVILRWVEQAELDEAAQSV